MERRSLRGLFHYSYLTDGCRIILLIGAKVQEQVAELIETLPETIDNAKVKLNDSSIGEEIVDKLSSKKSLDKAQMFATQFFKSTFGVFGDVYVILFTAIFFTISPKIYTKGMVQLIPVKGKKGKWGIKYYRGATT